jgi:lipoprotein-releasing system permease protein
MRTFVGMNFSRYFARRITFAGSRSFSRAAVTLAVISIALGVAVMEIALSTVAGFEKEITRKQVGFVGDVRIMTFMPEDADTLTLKHDPKLVAEIGKQMPEVSRMAPFAFTAGLLKSSESMEGIVLKGFLDTPDLAFFRENLREGKLPSLPDTGQRKQLLISRMLANKLLLKVGDKARLYFLNSASSVRARPVVITGIFETGMGEIDRDVVVCDLRMLQKIRRWAPDQVQGYDVHLSYMPQEGSDYVTAKLNGLIPHFWKARSVYELFPELFEWLNLQHQNVFFILILMTLAAVVNMSTAVIILILERTRTIGVLRAIGASRRQIRSIFLWNSFFLITIGVFLGNVIAFGLLWLQDSTGVLQMDPDSYFITKVPVAWVWESFFVVNVLVIIVCTIAMALPVWLVSRVQVTRALKFD